jgi:hypothetical protein
MTPVRQNAADKISPPTARKVGRAATPKAKLAGRQGSQSAKKRGGAPIGGASQVAQVRLQADEVAALQDAMQQLRLPSTSEALREGIRLLIHEASELAAAETIRRFYGDTVPPLPDGVVGATEEDLAAADAEQW